MIGPTWKPHGPAVLLRGSCRDLLPLLAATAWRWHAAVGDPPYGLDFLGHAWDRGDGCVAHDPDTWRALAACGVPGAHAIMMSADTTYHRLGAAMEQAGFECRHMIPWLYATGRCQSQRVAGGDPEHDGLAPKLAPGCEPAFLGRLPLEAGCSVAENLRRHGTGALRVEAVRSGVSEADAARRRASLEGFDNTPVGYGSRHPRGGAEFAEGGRYPKALVHDGSPEVVGVFNRRGNRVSRSREEGNVDRGLPSYSKRYGGGPRREIVGSEGSGARYFPSVEVPLVGDEGDSCRYEPKPKGKAREVADGHPTPKPEPLVRWHTRLVTCFPGQWVIDPFLGSGTTMRAALDEHMRCLGIELDEVTAGGLTACTGYCATVARRCPEVLDHVVARALADLGLRVAVEPGVGVCALGDRTPAASGLVVTREDAGEATCRDPLGRALGLTLEDQRVPLRRAWLEVDLCPGAPADLADKLAELAGWPEVQALLCRRGDLTGA